MRKMLASFQLQVNRLKTTNPICPWNWCRDEMCVCVRERDVPSHFVSVSARGSSKWMWLKAHFGSAGHLALVVPGARLVLGIPRLLQRGESRFVLRSFLCIIITVGLQGHRVANCVNIWIFGFLRLVFTNTGRAWVWVRWCINCKLMEAKGLSAAR